MRSPLPQQAPTRRPRLLFLSYLFPPVISIACVRTWNIAKYLARLGWDVTVVTPQPSVWRQRENTQQTELHLHQEGIRRILTNHRWRCLAPDRLNCWNRGLGWLAGGVCRRIVRRLNINEEIGWIKAAEHACSVLTPDDVDIILATGSPFSTFKLAKTLSEKLGRPYVLDYRDPWTGNLHADQPDRPTIIQQEARLLRSAAAVTVVSRAWGLDIERRFSLGPKLHVVTNGYDPEELVTVKPHDFGHVAIVYTGAFYPPKRVISPVMAALQRLKGVVGEQGSDWYFHYYGGQTEHVSTEARRFGVADRLVIHSQVPREEALSAVCGAGVSVVITTVAEKGTLADLGMVTGKLYEALGLSTPVLLIAPIGSDASGTLVGAVTHASFPGSDIEGISLFLRQLIEGKIRRNDTVVPPMYAWPALAGQVDSLLRSLLQR